MVRGIIKAVKILCSKLTVQYRQYEIQLITSKAKRTYLSGNSRQLHPSLSKQTQTDLKVTSSALQRALWCPMEHARQWAKHRPIPESPGGVFPGMLPKASSPRSHPHHFWHQHKEELWQKLGRWNTTPPKVLRGGKMWFFKELGAPKSSPGNIKEERYVWAAV